MKKSDIEYRIIIHPEHESPEGCFSSGDDEQDAADVAKIMEDLEWNDWAWCTVEVQAVHVPSGLTGSDWLGCCSYDSEEQFTEPGGYYDDMKERALEELESKVETLQD